MNIEILKSYIKDELSVEEKTALRKTLKEKPDTQLLIDIIDACLAKVKKTVSPAKHLSPDGAENLVIRLLTFNTSRADAVSFLGNFLYNPSFYPILQSSMGVATTDLSLTDDMPEIRIQTDREIYRSISSLFRSKFRRRSFFSFRWAELKLSGAGTIFKRPVLATLFACILIAVFGVHRMGQQENILYSKYFNEYATPARLVIPSSSSQERVLRSFRSNDTNISADVVESFKLAKASYMAADYKDAVAEFQNIESKLESFDQHSAIDFKLEFYFYNGLSHFNLVGSKGQSKSHLKGAISNLTSYYSTSSTEKISMPDDVPFFLALAHDMDGNEDAMREIISKISNTSPYFKDSKQLLTNN